MPKSYSPEFRKKVLDLLKAGRPVAEVASGLGVTAASIYNWRNQELIDTGKKAGTTTTENTELSRWCPQKTVRGHLDEGQRRKAASRGTYGSRRVHAEPTLGQNISVGREAVAMLMRRAGIVGVVGSPKRKSIPNIATSSDLVKRDFARAAPNQLWVTDITEHRTREGKIYCAVVLDTYSRRVV